MMVNESLESLARDFWIAAHFLARQTCSGYVARGCSHPQTLHEVGVFAVQARALFRSYAVRAVDICGCAPEDFWVEVQATEGWLYEQNHQDAQ